VFWEPRNERPAQLGRVEALKATGIETLKAARIEPLKAAFGTEATPDTEGVGADRGNREG